MIFVPRLSRTRPMSAGKRTACHIQQARSTKHGMQWVEARTAVSCRASSFHSRAHTSNRLVNPVFGLARTGTAGLPSLLVVQATQPASDVRALPEFITNYSGSELSPSVTVGYGAETGCTYADVSIRCAFSDVGFKWDVNLRTVMNTHAVSGQYSFEFYESYVADASDRLAGNDEGYSRYLDSHLGLMIINGTSEDANARALTMAGVGYHNGGESSEVRFGDYDLVITRRTRCAPFPPPRLSLQLDCIISPLRFFSLVLSCTRVLARTGRVAPRVSALNFMVTMTTRISSQPRSTK